MTNRDHGGMMLAEPEQGSLLDLLAQVHLSVNRLGDHLEWEDRRRRELAQHVYPLDIPPQFGTVTAGGVLAIANAELLGPRTGEFWDIRRITVAGLASSSEIATIYKGSTGAVTNGVAVDAVNNNAVAQVTGKVGTYGPGKSACILRAGQFISVGGSSLTASEIVWLVMEGTRIAAPCIGEFLL